MALAEYAIANVPISGTNFTESLAVAPASPYALTVGTPIVPIVLTVDDADGGGVTLDEISGALPAGLTINRVLPYTATVQYTATISGTPTLAGAYSVTYESDDGIGTVATQTLVFNVAVGAPPPVIGGGPNPIVGGGAITGRARGRGMWF